MSDLLFLLLAAAASAWGTAMLLAAGLPRWLAALGVLVYLVLGIHAVLLGWVGGDGLVLPGRQVSPGLLAFYLSEAAQGFAPVLNRWLLLLAPVLHVVVALVRRPLAKRLLPASLVFLFLFVEVSIRVDRPPTRFEQVVGPQRVAYLTIAARTDGTRLVFATGAPMATFLQVLEVHDAEGAPRELELFWTRDGRGLVLRLNREHLPSFAIDVDGRTAGRLPEAAREWPDRPQEYRPADVHALLQRARRDVDEFVREHGGLLRGE